MIGKAVIRNTYQSLFLVTLFRLVTDTIYATYIMIYIIVYVPDVRIVSLYIRIYL